MFSISVDATFEAAHRLLHYEGRCSSCHGHSYKVRVTVCSTKLSSQGFVVDFGDLKKIVKGWIDTEWDHACILHKDDQLIPYLFSLKNKIFIMPDNPTAEHMAFYLYGTFINLIKDVDIESVTVWETPNNPATYKPTKKEI